MRHIMMKTIVIISVLTICCCLLTACSDSDVKDNNSENIPTSESYNETIDKEDTDTTNSGVSDDENSESNDTTTNTENETTTDSSEQTTDNKNESTSTTENENSTTANQDNQTTSCSHSTTNVVNKTSATCTYAGYTGDTYCTKCNEKIATGSQIKATNHKNTEIRNQKSATTSSEGYTGDTYCKDCGTKTATGNTIPKIEDDHSGKMPFELADGSIYWAESFAEVRRYTMKNATKTVNHQYSDIEQEILRLINIERAKVGVAALSWYEDAYCFTKIRADECFISYSHTRPNSKDYYTVYTDAGVLLYGSHGENLAMCENYDTSFNDGIAQYLVDGWMDSPGHKANILNPKYTEVSIAVVQNGTEIVGVQNFFG